MVVLAQLNEYLDDKRCDKIDAIVLYNVMTKIKEFELKDEYNADGDEYRDAFEALGGGPGK